MKYKIERASQFKKDFKLAEKQGLDVDKLIKVIAWLANRDILPKEYKDHPLMGNYEGHRECHIEFDWLLIYKIKEKSMVLSLVRTGSHSELFGK